MNDHKHSSSNYRSGSGGTPAGDGRGGQRYMGGRNGGRGDRRPKERDGRDQRMRGGRGRVKKKYIRCLRGCGCVSFCRV